MKTNLNNIFETDEIAEQEGFELEVYEGDTVVKIMLARAGGANKKFATRLQARLKPYKRKIDLGQMDDEIAEDILTRTISETLVLGWTGVLDENDEEVPCNKENAYALLSALPGLRDLIYEEAQRISNFQSVERETNSGN